MVTVELIQTEHQHDKAMQRLFELAELDLEKDEKAAEEFEILSILIEKYESKYCQLTKPDPVEIIRFYMEQNNLTNKDMQQYLDCSKGTVSKILNYRTPLTLPKIWKLNEELGIPVELLAQKYPIKQIDIQEKVLETLHTAFEMISPKKGYQFSVTF